jgi:hypothetical protein
VVALAAVLLRLDLRRAAAIPLAVALLVAIAPGLSRAQELDTLIDELTAIGSPAPGVDGMAWYSAFIADSAAPRFQGGVLGSPAPAIPPQMRELVRRGLAALPVLIRHLGDNRPTKLVVGGLLPEGGFYMFQYFSDEYDPRGRAADPRKAGAGSSDRVFVGSFSGRYTVKVGDLCYVLVGQIVNRRLVAVRYQPSSGLVINSPLEAPDLVEKVEKDWSGLEAQGHKASLLADIDDDDIVRSSDALIRLRFYYPDTYRSLQGGAQKKRLALEAAEKRN